MNNEPPVPEGWRGRRRTPVLGLSVAALWGFVGVVIAFTSCFGTGFVWTPSTPTPTATSTSTPTSTPTSTSTPTATATPTQGAINLPPIGPGERWVRVDISDQTAQAMVGNDVYYTAYVTTGKDGWQTPIGEFRILYRVADETMTSAAIGAEDYYVLDHVLFTQYFTTEGHALHLNYWRPDSVFGHERTSHGCVGMRYADAEFFWNFVNVGSRVVIQP